jgi:hypothetical protein
MRTLIPALAAASMLMIALPGYSAEEVTAPGKSADKPARALNDDVTAPGKSTKPARAIDDGAVKSGGPSDKPGRAIEDGAVKSSGATTDKQGRTVDAEKKSKKKKKKVQPQN